MATRSKPPLLGASMAPLGASGLGAVLHMYVGISPSMAAVLAVIVTMPAIVATIACTVIPHRPAIVREKSMAQIRSAVIEGKIEAKDAVLLLGDAVRVSATSMDQEDRHRRVRGRSDSRRNRVKDVGPVPPEPAPSDQESLSVQLGRQSGTVSPVRETAAGEDATIRASAQPGVGVIARHAAAGARPGTRPNQQRIVRPGS